VKFGAKMIQQIVDAIFENGVFRPLKPIDDPMLEGQQVQLIVQSPESSEDILALAADVYAGLAEEEIDEIKRIALDRGDFFGDEAE
jgi:predicted DNA-binding antitoxin AbrB/MazE fold protein